MTTEVHNVEGKEKEDWMQQKWRPAMGWLYMAVCAFDFMLAPVLWSIVQALGNGGHIESQWQPLTLQGAGLFHVAMGAVLGIAAFGRTQEKMAGAAGGNGAPTTPGFGTPAPQPSFGAPRPQPSFSAPAQPAFGSQPLGNNSVSTAPAFGSTKPVQPDHPEL